MPERRATRSDTSSQRKALAFRWTLSQSYLYRVELLSEQRAALDEIAKRMQQETHADSAERRPPLSTRLRLAATLEISPLARLRSSEWLLAYRWRGVRMELQVNGEPLTTEQRQRLRQELEQLTVFVQMNERGQIQRVWFSPLRRTSMAPDIARALLARVQVALPDAPRAEWQSDEESPEGVYRARYRRTGQTGARWTILKQRVRYLQAQSLADSSELRPDGQLTILFDSAAGILRSVEGRYTTTMLSDGHRLMEETSELRLKFESNRPLSVAQRRSLLAAHQKVGTQPQSLRAVEREPSEAERMATYRQMLGKETLETLLSALQQLPTDAPLERASPLMNQWLALVAIQPTVCARVEQELRRLPMQHAQAQVLLFALQSAGYAPAQATLRRLAQFRLQQRDLDGYAYLISLIAMLAQPDEANEAFLFPLAQDPHPEVAYPARLALGSVGHAVLNRQPARSAKIREWVARQLKQSEIEEELEIWLLTLGNLGHPDALTDLLRFVKHPSARIRAAATLALRFVPQPEAERALLEALQYDEAHTVRSAALSAFNYRPLSVAAVRGFQAALKTEPDRELRRAILDRLWQERERRPEAIRIVQQTAESDPETELRLYARSLLQQR